MQKKSVLLLLSVFALTFNGCFLLNSSGKSATLAVTPTQVGLHVNGTAQLTVVVQDEKGRVMNVEENDIQWVIENIDDEEGDLVAVLDKTTGAKVTVEGKRVGEAKITVVYQELRAKIPVVVYSTVATISQLIELSNPKDGEKVYVQGYWEADDGGGGIFTYSANNTKPADGGMIIAPANKRGRWLRVVSEDEPLNIRWYGARSGVDECQGVYLKAAIDYFFKQKKTGTVLIPEGLFSIGTSLGFYEGVSLIGEGIDVSVIKNISSGYRYNSFFNHTSHYSPERYLRMSMSDLTIDVNMYNLGTWIGAIWVEDYFRELTIERVRFTNSGGNIIRLMKSSVIADSIWDNMDGRALSTGWENKPDLRFRDNVIRNNMFIRTAAAPQGPGINLSRAESNIVIGNQVININRPDDSYGGIRVPNGSDNNLIEGNIVKNFPRGIWVMSGSQNNVVRENTVIDSWIVSIFINASHEDKRSTSGNVIANNIIIQENPLIGSADLIRLHEDFSKTIFDNVVEGNEVRITSSYYNAYKRGKSLVDDIVYLTNGAEIPGRNLVRDNVLVITD